MARKKLTVLSPKPGKLPSTTALIGVRICVLTLKESTMAGYVVVVTRLKVTAHIAAHIAAHITTSHVAIHVAIVVAIHVGIMLHVMHTIC